jgi:hypothetical protein
MAKRHASRLERMEDDLNRSSFNDSGVCRGGRPRKSPSYVRAVSCEPVQGPAQPQKAIPVEREQPKEGNVASAGPVAAPSQVGPADGFCVDERGGGTRGSRLRSRMRWATTLSIQFVQVTDEEADARSEWRNQNHCVSPPGRLHVGTHVAVHARSSGIRPPIFPRRSTGREPVLARPTTYGGRLDEDGTSTGRFDF